MFLSPSSFFLPPTNRTWPRFSPNARSVQCPCCLVCVQSLWLVPNGNGYQDPWLPLPYQHVPTAMFHVYYVFGWIPTWVVCYNYGPYHEYIPGDISLLRVSLVHAWLELVLLPKPYLSTCFKSLLPKEMQGSEVSSYEGLEKSEGGGSSRGHLRREYLIFKQTTPVCTW